MNIPTPHIMPPIRISIVAWICIYVTDRPYIGVLEILHEVVGLTFIDALPFRTEMSDQIGEQRNAW